MSVNNDLLFVLQPPEQNPSPPPNSFPITIGERWGKRSYHVQYDGPYDNNRSPHVETEIKDLTGKVFRLGKREKVPIKGRTNTSHVAICYEVIGLTNEGEKAHITVYFGKEEGSEKY